MEDQAVIYDLQVSIMRLSEERDKWQNLAKSLGSLIIPFASLLTPDEKDMLMKVVNFDKKEAIQSE